MIWNESEMHLHKYFIEIYCYDDTPFKNAIQLNGINSQPMAWLMTFHIEITFL